MKQFVPLTDEMLYSLVGPPVPLVPYRCGLPCQRELSEEHKPPVRAREESMPSASLSAHLPA